MCQEVINDFVCNLYRMLCQTKLTEITKINCLELRTVQCGVYKELRTVQCGVYKLLFENMHLGRIACQNDENIAAERHLPHLPQNEWSDWHVWQP